MATNVSPRFEGRFGRMFRSLRPAFDLHDSRVLKIFAELAEKMSADYDPPKDGQDRTRLSRCWRATCRRSTRLLNDRESAGEAPGGLCCT
jgi:hypothetical protein